MNKDDLENLINDFWELSQRVDALAEIVLKREVDDLKHKVRTGRREIDVVYDIANEARSKLRELKSDKNRGGK